jgi:hypothetical protein
MKGTPAIYLGRIVDKTNFRVFIYGANGEKKLVESWDDFEASMQSGIWFTTADEIKPSSAILEESNCIEIDKKLKLKSKPRPKPKLMVVKEVDDSRNELPNDGSVFEVTNDFLSKETE